MWRAPILKNNLGAVLPQEKTATVKLLKFGTRVQN